MASAPAEFRAWHDLDWRFLLPQPNLGRVWLDSNCAEERIRLAAAGVVVSDETDGGIDVALVDGCAFDAASLQRKLPPRTLVRLAVGAARPRFQQRSLRRWTSWRKHLQAHGWDVLGCYWASPQLSRPRGYADVADRRAVRRLLRMTRGQHRLPDRIRLEAAVFGTIVGLSEFVCREGIVLARTPE